jgi:hypothetical protein
MLFKRAYVRGVQNLLMQSGHVAFPDATSAIKVADYIADRVDVDPLKEGGVPREVTGKIAEHIIDASTYLQKQPGFKAASITKLASVEDLSKLAHDHAIDVMQKAAEGSTIQGGDKGNTEPQSQHAEAKMDLGNRPEGYAEHSRGKTDVDTRPGAVGKEQENPKKPSESPPGDNSVIEQTRTASLADLIRKVAASGTGTTIFGGDKGNQEPTTAEGKMDMKQRPQGYAVLPGQGDLGELMRQYGGAAAVGKEVRQPNAPSNSPSGTNSVTQTSAKSAEEDPYLAVFKKTATEVVPHLPAHLGDEEKIAHVRACMGLTPDEKAHYLVGVQQKMAAATVPAVLPGSRSDGYTRHNAEATHSRPGAYDGRKGNQGMKQADDSTLPPFMQHDKDDEKEKKTDDKKEDKEHSDDKKHDEKEASLAERMRAITVAVQRGAGN